MHKGYGATSLSVELSDSLEAFQNNIETDSLMLLPVNFASNLYLILGNFST